MFCAPDSLFDRVGNDTEDIDIGEICPNYSDGYRNVCSSMAVMIYPSNKISLPARAKQEIRNLLLFYSLHLSPTNPTILAKAPFSAQRKITIVVGVV